MEARNGSPSVPVLLTIAGFDPSSGAGVTADLKTFGAHNCYGVAVITSVTIQNTRGVRGRHDLPAALIAEQIAALAEDIPLTAVKIGMLGTAANAKAVASAIERVRPPFVVVDPILRSSSGAELLDRTAMDALTERLLPKATLITPNIEEASVLTGLRVQTVEEAKTAAEVLHRMCGARVVITGGHLEKPNDVFFDGAEYTVLSGERSRTDNTHGTGCAFSAAIAANVALGKSLADAIVMAKAFVTKAVERGFAPGQGTGVLNHLYRLQVTPPPRSVITDPVEAHSGHR